MNIYIIFGERSVWFISCDLSLAHTFMRLTTTTTTIINNIVDLNNIIIKKKCKFQYYLYSMYCAYRYIRFEIYDEIVDAS